MKDTIVQYKNKKIKYIILRSLFNHMIKNIKTNISLGEGVNLNNNTNHTSLPQLVFKPGSILLTILKEESIIFKNIHEVSTEIFERFNELFGSERILSLNEDIYGTLFKTKKEEEKVISRMINLK